MKVYEIINEDANTIKQFGRPFNHPEHFVFFVGTEGIIEALNHFKEIAREKENETTVRKKWDGNPQIYWGREQVNGPLILTGHNGWSRGAKTTSQEELKDFIANKSGSPKTAQERQEREQFAENFSQLYPLFDRATPKDYVGFVYADSLFGVDPSLNKQLIKKEGYPKGVWTFAPNEIKGGTRYYVDADSELGRKISKAQIMIAAHGTFDNFGAPDREQKQGRDFSIFNTNPKLLVVNPIFSNKGTEQDVSKIDQLIDKVISEAQGFGPKIDAFLASIPYADRQGIFYPFFNAMSFLHAKGKQDFGSINVNTFKTWMLQKNVSKNKQERIAEMIAKFPNVFDNMVELMADIRNLKDEAYTLVKAQEASSQNKRPEIWDSNSEGYVRYAQPHHKFGNIKLVPTTWTPEKT